MTATQPETLSVEDTMRSLLAEVAHMRTDPTTLAATDDLFAAGLSSLATVDLMLAIEDRFELEFTSAWLNRRTFASIAALSNAVRQMKEHAP
ncbi:MAG: acyl carrier protein [Acetobacteraceae bacterium]|nr:acyl carrier protein [Acetobacteraceae bacterium]